MTKKEKRMWGVDLVNTRNVDDSKLSRTGDSSEVADYIHQVDTVNMNSR